MRPLKKQTVAEDKAASRNAAIHSFENEIITI